MTQSASVTLCLQFIQTALTSGHILATYYSSCLSRLQGGVSELGKRLVGVPNTVDWSTIKPAPISLEEIEGSHLQLRTIRTDAPDAEPWPAKDSAQRTKYSIFGEIQIVQIDMSAIEILFGEQERSIANKLRLSS